MHWRDSHAETLARITADPVMGRNRFTFTDRIRQWHADGGTGLGAALSILVELMERANLNTSVPPGYHRRAVDWPDEIVVALLFLARDALDASAMPAGVLGMSPRPRARAASDAALTLARSPLAYTEEGAQVLGALVARFNAADRVSLACTGAAAIIVMGMPLADLKALAAQVA